MPPLTCHDCPTALEGRDRTKSRCARCRSRRRPTDQAHRREIAEALFPPQKRAALLKRLAAGQALGEACAALGTAPQAAFGYRAYDQEWAALLDDALMAGRDPDLAHGSENAYRIGRCRCPECRAGKRARRQTP